MNTLESIFNKFVCQDAAADPKDNVVHALTNDLRDAVIELQTVRHTLTSNGFDGEGIEPLDSVAETLMDTLNGSATSTRPPCAVT